LIFFVAFTCILWAIVHTQNAFLFCMQNNMKKLFAVLAALLLAFSFGVFASDHGEEGHADVVSEETTEEVTEETEEIVEEATDADEEVMEVVAIAYNLDSVERVEGSLVAVNLQDAISYLYTNGLTMFGTEATFMGSQGLRRDEAAAFFARFARDVLGMEVDADAEGCDFSDLATAHQDLLGEIQAACQLGLMRGHAGKFMPTDTLSNAHAMTVLVRLLAGDQEEPAGNWAANYAAVAKAAGLTASLAADNAANLYAPITRADVAKMIEAASIYEAPAGEETEEEVTEEETEEEVTEEETE
jgi:hypothetical protein